MLLCENCQHSACEPFFLALFFCAISAVPLLSFSPVLTTSGCANFIAFFVKVHAFQGALWFHCRAAVILENLIIKG